MCVKCLSHSKGKLLVVAVAIAVGMIGSSGTFQSRILTRRVDVNLKN